MVCVQVDCGGWWKCGGGGGESGSALGGGAVLCFGRRLVAIARSSAKSGELRVESERTAAAARPGCRLSRLHPDLERGRLTKACELSIADS